MSSGSRPPCSRKSTAEASLIWAALVRYSPQDLTSPSSSPMSASAMAWGVGYLSNSFTDTAFTRSSVHWADRRPITSSRHGSPPYCK